MLARILSCLLSMTLSACGASGANPPAGEQQPASRSGEQSPVPVRPASGAVWLTHAQIAALPMSGPAWETLLQAADGSCGIPALNEQEDPTNICVLAKALVFARTGRAVYRDGVIAALRSIVASGRYEGRALALARELPAYVIAADLIGLRSFDPALDAQFRARLRELRTTPTSPGPANLIVCHEDRPNNWGTHCGASRLAVAIYLGDRAEVQRVAQVFRGWLGDRSAYAGFRYRDLAWQCDELKPVGINPKGCVRYGVSLDGVLPDDQRRSGPFAWPPPHENYAYEALQGALAQAVMLDGQGYDVFDWGDRALLRAFQWLYGQAHFPAQGDDQWQVHVINAAYGTRFPATVPARPGKNVGWTDWTHAR